MEPRVHDLHRIREALLGAGAILRGFSRERVGVRCKEQGGPVTEADLAVDAALRGGLPRPGEGWLSEETPDDRARLDCHRVWVVDPLDGTREFLEGVPQWNVSIGLVEDGTAVAGGVYNPTTEELFLGAPGLGTRGGGTPRVSAHNGGGAGATLTGSASARPCAPARICGILTLARSFHSRPRSQQ